MLVTQFSVLFSLAMQESANELKYTRAACNCYAAILWLNMEH